MRALRPCRVLALWRSSPKLVFEGPEDRLDALADRGEMRAVSGLVSAAGSQHHGAVAFGDGGGELFAGVALVGDDRLSAAQADRQQAQHDVAFFWSAGARIAARGVPSGAASRCSRIPKTSTMAAAVPIAARVSQRGAPERFRSTVRTPPAWSPTRPGHRHTPGIAGRRCR